MEKSTGTVGRLLTTLFMSKYGDLEREVFVQIRTMLLVYIGVAATLAFVLSITKDPGIQYYFIVGLIFLLVISIGVTRAGHYEKPSPYPLVALGSL